MELPKELNNEIWEYCRLNEITNMDEFKVKLVKNGFTIEKYGSAPAGFGKEPKEIISFEVKKNIFLKELRIKRNELLTQSDWTQFTDVIETKSQEFILEWRTYRQLLRDLPQQYFLNDMIDFSDIIWPTQPTIV